MKRRRAFTVLELLIAAGLLLVVISFLWAGIRQLVAGTGRAEWRAAAGRSLEGFYHLVRQKAGQANHLVAVDERGAVHPPAFSALWILEEGRGIGFRVFPPDQMVPDPDRIDPDALRQQQVFFLQRDRELVLIERGGDGAPPSGRLEVLLTDVERVEFASGLSLEDGGALDGVLEVTVELGRTSSKESYERRLTVHLAVPVLAAAAPAGADFLAAPSP